LDAGESIIGDGGYTYALERRGYMTPGEWTPEVVVEYPDAGMTETLHFPYDINYRKSK